MFALMTQLPANHVLIETWCAYSRTPGHGQVICQEVYHVNGGWLDIMPPATSVFTYTIWFD